MTEYTRRQLDRVTRLALERTAQDGSVGWEDRSKARAALDRQGRPAPDLREPYVARYQVQPGLWLTVDASHNILLEVRTTDEAELLAAYALSSVNDTIGALEMCRMARDSGEYDVEQARLRHLTEHQAAVRWSAPREGEDADSRAAVTAELAAAGLNEHAVQLVLRRAYGHQGGTFSVEGTELLGTATYDREAGTYAVRVPERGCCGKPGSDCTGPCARSYDPARPVDISVLASLVGQDDTRWEDPRDTRDGLTAVPGIAPCPDTETRHSAHEWAGGTRWCEGAR